MTDKTDMSKEREAFIKCHMQVMHSDEMMAAHVWDNDHLVAMLWRAGRASLSANAGEPPRDGWLHENGLLYRLTDERHPCNRDEINVTMADGSRSIEARSRRALELLDRIRAAPSTAQAEGWMPIETAPKDGTSLLLMRKHCGSIADGFFRSGAWIWAYVRKEPTHWMYRPPTSAEGVEHG